MEHLKTTALIGYTGFVGSNLNIKYDFTHKYNSKNIDDIKKKTFDCVVCAGISATKWWANSHPIEDLQNIQNLLDILITVTTTKFILISTIDVYDNICNGDEETKICSVNNHAYGKNRYYVETFIKEHFCDHLIIRLPGLFGYGLKKNIIYDYLNNNLKELNINSSFQWYNITNLFNDIQASLNGQLNIINLFTEPINNKDLHNIFLKYNSNVTYDLVNGPQLHYNIKTQYGTYIDTKKNVLCQIDKYIDNMLNNKLIISNLSWKHNDDESMLNKLNMFGIKSLEVSPYKYFDNSCEIDKYPLQKKYDIYAFQSILYPHTFNIFTEFDIAIEYFNKIIIVAKHLGVKILVFGSPKNRRRGQLSYNEAINYAVLFFKQVSQVARDHNIIIAIEPNAQCYGCDFITNSVEGRELVLKVNSPFFRLHLDVGCMYLENENILSCINNNLDILAHIHFSAPQLKCLSSNSKINYKELFYKIKKTYNKMISIEMLNQTDFDIFKDIITILE